MRIISASRRTDIPAFYTPWLLRRLDAGYCHTINPVSGQVGRVSLRPEDVYALGLFSRDPSPLLPALPSLLEQGHRAYLHMTINGYGKRLEPNSPAVERASRVLRAAADILGPDFTIWRYDPIIISRETDSDWHVRRFRSIAEKLEGATGKCMISFVDPYKKTLRNVDDEVGWTVSPQHVRLAAELARIADRRGIRLKSCAEPLAREAGIETGACVDADLVGRLRPGVALRGRRSPTRDGCGCFQAVDIGVYHTCAFGCAYCYATESPSVGRHNHRAHVVNDSILFRTGNLRGVDLDALVRQPSHRASGDQLTLPIHDEPGGS